MASFRCYDNSGVIATLIMTNFHLNKTVVANFPNACLWRHSLYSNLVLTLKTNCIKPSSYASTVYVVVIRPSFLSDSFVKIWATCKIFWGKWFTVPPGKKIPIRLWVKYYPAFYSARRNSKKIYSYQLACKAEKKNWGRKHFLFRQPGVFKCWPLSRYPPSLLALKDCLNNSRVCPLKCHVALLLPNQS